MQVALPAVIWCYNCMQYVGIMFNIRTFLSGTHSFLSVHTISAITSVDNSSLATIFTKFNYAHTQGPYTVKPFIFVCTLFSRVSRLLH